MESVETVRTIQQVVNNLLSEVHGIQDRKQLEPSRGTRSFATGDAYRGVTDLCSAIREGRITSSEQLKSLVDYKGIVLDLGADISLRMSLEPISNERLKQETQMANTIAYNLKKKGVTFEQWQESYTKLQSLLSNKQS